MNLYLGRIGNTLCPVAAVLGYLAICPSTPGPLFHFQGGTPLSRTHLVTHVWDALSCAGIDASQFSGHSFRIGAASTAAQARLNDSLIQMLGRWKSSAFTAYPGKVSHSGSFKAGETIGHTRAPFTYSNCTVRVLFLFSGCS